MVDDRRESRAYLSLANGGAFCRYTQTTGLHWKGHNVGTASTSSLGMMYIATVERALPPLCLTGSVDWFVQKRRTCLPAGRFGAVGPVFVKKVGIKNKRLCCGWSPDYLLRVVTQNDQGL